MVCYITYVMSYNISYVMLYNICYVIYNNYSNCLNYSTILTEPEVNNCFSIFTRSDLNRIRKETIKKTLV